MRKLNNKQWIAVAAAIVAVVVILFGSDIWTFFGGQTPSTRTPITAPENAILPFSEPGNMNNISNTAGLEIYDEVVGQGDEATAGSLVTVHYTGVLSDGTKFDSSLDRNDPFQFPLGQGYVIQGWDLGVQGMRVGGVRRLVISPELGYGAQGAGNLIPPNSTLIFQVQLLEVGR